VAGFIRVLRFSPVSNIILLFTQVSSRRIKKGPVKTPSSMQTWSNMIGKIKYLLTAKSLPLNVVTE
jgi:hypothetical protein